MMPPGYQARGERVIMIRIAAWDANCPQHIPQRIAAADVAAALAQRDARIAALESALAAATAATTPQRQPTQTSVQKLAVRKPDAAALALQSTGAVGAR